MDKRSIIQCPLCGRENSLSVLYKGTVKGRPVLRCKQCGVWVLSHFPSESEKKSIYGDDYYIRWGYDDTIIGPTQNIKKQLYSDVLDKIILYGPLVKILDIGCAMGFSLDVLKERGLESYGVEISEFAGRIAQERFGSTVSIGDIKDIKFEDDFFDAVTMVDILEHVESPILILKKIRQILKRRGILAIVVPDTGSFSAKALKSAWPHINNEHLYYFSPPLIKNILYESGFLIESVRSFAKPVSLSYAASVLKNTRPDSMLYRLFDLMTALVPVKLRSKCFRMPMGEMLVIARKA